VSYFFCASAPLLDAASTANAAETIAILFMVTGITVSLVPLTLMACVMAFLIERLLVTLESDSTALNQTLTLSFFPDHDLFGKPVSTFPDHALASEYHFAGTLTTKSPCDEGAGAASLVVS
jgi:hypothetical protein